MKPHLAEVSQAVASDAHAILVVDQVGWHTTDKLDVPDNITIVPLPPPPRVQPGGQSGRKRLAVHARELALEPRLRELRRHRRVLLRGLEQARRSALEDHVDRKPRLGPSVVINEAWYNP
jgi:hypothetical protein